MLPTPESMYCNITLAVEEPAAEFVTKADISAGPFTFMFIGLWLAAAVKANELISVLFWI